MPDNKLVIRKLPPDLGEDEFLKLISPIPNHDYFCYFGPNSGVGQHTYCRAYINFLETNDMNSFKRQFNNHVFTGKDGLKYRAIVDEALWSVCPRSGPFYIGTDSKLKTDDSNLRGATSGINSRNLTCKSDVNSNSNMSSKSALDDDTQFLEFVAKLNESRKTQLSRH